MNQAASHLVSREELHATERERFLKARQGIHKQKKMISGLGNLPIEEAVCVADFVTFLWGLEMVL